MEHITLQGKIIFVTDVVGFIGSDLAARLLKDFDCKVVGLDNMND